MQNLQKKNNCKNKQDSLTISYCSYNIFKYKIQALKPNVFLFDNYVYQRQIMPVMELLLKLEE